jgi:hypothetical protein
MRLPRVKIPSPAHYLFHFSSLSLGWERGMKGNIKGNVREGRKSFTPFCEEEGKVFKGREGWGGWEGKEGKGGEREDEREIEREGKGKERAGEG